MMINYTKFVLFLSFLCSTLHAVVVVPPTFTVVQPLGTNLHSVIDSGAVAASQSGVWSTGRTWNLSSGSDSISAVQSGSWSVSITGSVPLPTNAAIESGGHLQSIDSKITTTANGIKVDGSGVTQPISGTVAATQSGPWTVTANAGTGTFQTNVTNSSIPVTQSGTWTTGRTWNLSSGSDSVSAAQSGSWTVTANAGTGTFNSKDAADGPVSPGAVASNSILVGGQFNAIPPTLTDGQQAALQVDSSGNLKTTATISMSTVTADQGAPNTLSNGWPVKVTDGTNVLGVSSHPIRIDPTGSTTQPVSGTVTANQGGTWTTGRTWNLSSLTDSVASVQSGAWTTGRTWTLSSGSDSVSALVSNFPATQDVNLTQIGGSAPSATNWVPARVTNGTSYVDPTQIRALTSSDVVTAQQGGSWTVTANAGTGTFQTNVTNSSIPVTQSGTWTTGRTWTLSSGTDTVGSVQSGSWTVTANAGTGTFNTTDSSDGPVIPGTVAANSSLAGGQFNASPPTLTDGQQVALQVDSSGNLKTTSSISGTVTANQGSPNIIGNSWPVEVTDGTNILGTSSHPVRIDPTGSTTQPISGTVTANQGGTWTTGRTWTLSSGTDSVASVQSGTWTTGRTWTLSSGTDSVAATQSGSWTVTANAGTGTFNTKDSADGPVTPGTVAANSILTGGQFNATPPTVTDGQQVALQVDASGNLKTATTLVSSSVTANQGTTPWVDNVTQFGSNNVVTGTGASGLGIPRVTVSNDSNVLATQSGAWTTGRTWTLSSGTDSVAATQSGTWTVQQGTPPWSVSQSGSWTVTANIGTTGGLALDTSVNGILVAQGSTTSGQTGPLIQGAVTTSAPSYSTGKTDPLSLTTAGALRTDSSATTQPISGTVTVNQGTNPWTDNISQFGGNNVVTGTGASGVGIPRVTVSNDSNILATQSGAWTTGRTWTLSSGSDSVSAVQSGTWTVQQGTPPWSVVGNVASGASDSGNPVKVGGVFNTIFPTLTNGQRGDVQLDSSARLVIRPLVNTTDSVNSVQSGTWTTGRTWTLSSGTDSVSAVQSGTWTVQQGGAPWSVSQSGSWTVTANAGTNLNTSALALDTSVTGLQVSQGSTTSGQKGGLTLAAVTTSAPSYTTAQTSPLSLNASGGLRVDGSGVTQPVSGTITANQGTSPWVDNITQFGGNNVVTGTGASGVGIPRVTVSNDSNILATQSGTWTTGRTWTLSSGTDSVSAVQSGTWTVQQGTPPWSVVGNVASGASDSGNPVKIGGIFNTTQPTVTNGQRVDVQSTARGAQIVATGVDAFQISGNIASASSDSGNPVKTGAIFNTTLPTVTNGQRVDNQSDANGRQIVANAPLDGVKATYGACATNLTVATAATDIFTLTGSASKTIKLSVIRLAATQTTGAIVDMLIIKRSSADSGGTSTTLTAVPYDSTDSAASAVAKSYTANPTLGTAVGTIKNKKFTMDTAAKPVSALDDNLLLFGDRASKAPTLRGTSEQIVINMNGQTMTGNLFSICFEWTEE